MKTPDCCQKNWHFPTSALPDSLTMDPILARRFLRNSESPMNPVFRRQVCCRLLVMYVLLEPPPSRCAKGGVFARVRLAPACRIRWTRVLLVRDGDVDLDVSADGIAVGADLMGFVGQGLSLTLGQSWNDNFKVHLEPEVIAITEKTNFCPDA